MMMSPDRISITICGDGATGKSWIALRLVRSEYTGAYDPTIEDTYSFTRNIDGQPYHLSITDTAGQENYRSIWTTLDRTSDAFLLVYDITRQESLKVLEEFSLLINQKIAMQWRDSEQTLCDTRDTQNFNTTNWLEDVSCDLIKRGTLHVKPVKIVIGNMCDLHQRRQVLIRTGKDWAAKNGCSFMETSAKTIINIEEVLQLTVRKVLEAREDAIIAQKHVKSILTINSINNYQQQTYFSPLNRSECVTESSSTSLTKFKHLGDYDNQFQGNRDPKNDLFPVKKRSKKTYTRIKRRIWFNWVKCNSNRAKRCIEPANRY